MGMRRACNWDNSNLKQYPELHTWQSLSWPRALYLGLCCVQGVHNIYTTPTTEFKNGLMCSRDLWPYLGKTRELLTEHTCMRLASFSLEGMHNFANGTEGDYITIYKCKQLWIIIDCHTYIWLHNHACTPQSMLLILWYKVYTTLQSLYIDA